MKLPHIETSVSTKRVLILVIILVDALLIWAQFHNPHYWKTWKWGGDIRMVYHAVLGDNDWWFRFAGTTNIWEGWLYAEVEKYLLGWTVWFPSETSLVTFMFFVNVASYAYITWRLCALPHGFLLSVIGLRCFAWYLSTGNIAPAIGALCCTPSLSVLGAVLKPNGLSALFFHAVRYALRGSKDQDMVRRQPVFLATSSVRWSKLADWALYLTCAWYYWAYTIRDHHYYGIWVYLFPT